MRKKDTKSPNSNTIQTETIQHDKEYQILIQQQQQQQQQQQPHQPHASYKTMKHPTVCTTNQWKNAPETRNGETPDEIRSSKHTRGGGLAGMYVCWPTTRKCRVRTASAAQFLERDGVATATWKEENGNSTYYLEGGGGSSPAISSKRPITRDALNYIQRGGDEATMEASSRSNAAFTLVIHPTVLGDTKGCTPVFRQRLLCNTTTKEYHPD